MEIGSPVGRIGRPNPIPEIEILAIGPISIPQDRILPGNPKSARFQISRIVYFGLVGLMLMFKISVLRDCSIQIFSKTTAPVVDYM